MLPLPHYYCNITLSMTYTRLCISHYLNVYLHWTREHTGCSDFARWPYWCCCSLWAIPTDCQFPLSTISYNYGHMHSGPSTIRSLRQLQPARAITHPSWYHQVYHHWEANCNHHHLSLSRWYRYACTRPCVGTVFNWVAHDNWSVRHNNEEYWSKNEYDPQHMMGMAW